MIACGLVPQAARQLRNFEIDAGTVHCLSAIQPKSLHAQPYLALLRLNERLICDLQYFGTTCLVKPYYPRHGLLHYEYKNAHYSPDQFGTFGRTPYFVDRC